jgi:hypothetical protein
MDFYLVIFFAICFAFLFIRTKRSYSNALMSCVVKDGSAAIKLMQENDVDDDSDIKIAEEKPFSKKTEDTTRDANELEAQRRLGNLEKAHLLGEALSDKIVDEDGESEFGEDSSEDTGMRTQRRLLLAFAACSSIEKNIKSNVLQGVVLNVFYDTLKKSLPEFYSDISESGSFSFYTLCVRRGVDVDYNVGCTFAMLCGKENDSVIEGLGEALYIHFVDIVRKTIEFFDFKQ